MADLENSLEQPLRIGISTRALFDLEEEHRTFEEEGLESYKEMQIEREQTPLKKGAGFHVVERLLKLNRVHGETKSLVEVILMSKNSPDLSLRAFNSVTDLGLEVKLGSFVSGRTLAPFVEAWSIDLFLSFEEADVHAVQADTASACLLRIPVSSDFDKVADEVRFAFDGDAVLFGTESDEIYKTSGLEAFLENEKANAENPMSAGPFYKFFRKLSKLRELHMSENGESKIRIGIVTARNAPAHERVVKTLGAWGTPADEAHFVGPNEKRPIVKAMGAHIFFDDQAKHVENASRDVPSAKVPGPHSDDHPVIVSSESSTP